MTRVKQQVVEMLQDIPDDKVVHLSTAMGVFKNYSNPNMYWKKRFSIGELS